MLAGFLPGCNLLKFGSPDVARIHGFGVQWDHMTALAGGAVLGALKVLLNWDKVRIDSSKKVLRFWPSAPMRSP